jgi:hypothetical protein
MGITVHYIDGAWVLHSILLDFVPLHGVHSGEDLCKTLVATCEEFDILHKLLGVTTDNAANMVKLLGCLESICRSRGIMFERKEQHVRCLAHVTNLAMRALLDKFETGAEPDLNDKKSMQQARLLPCVTKLRFLVVQIRSSTQRRDVFRGHCAACRVPEKELIRDVCTRWNSAHAMIERACELQYPLSEMVKIDSGQ